MDSRIEQLLSVQEADMALILAEQHLKNIPESIKALEQRITLEHTALEESKKALQTQEVHRKQIDIELKEVEERIIKLKTQQIDVRKKEEYEALNTEIEKAQEKVSTLEEEELKSLFEIDEQKKNFLAEEKQRNQLIQDFKQEITQLKTREVHFRQQLDSLKSNFNQTWESLSSVLKSAYQSVKSTVKRAPFIVLIKDHHCQGCFLKVSNDVVSAARNPDVIARCSSCSRIVYM